MTSGRLMFFDHHWKYLLDRVPPVITVDNTSVLLQRMLFLSFLQVMLFQHCWILSCAC